MSGHGCASQASLLLPKSNFAQFISANAILVTLTSNLFLPTVGWILDLSGNTYRYAYLISGAMDLIAIVTVVMLLVQLTIARAVESARK